LERIQKKRNQMMTSLRMIKGVAGQPETGVEFHGQFLVLSGDPPVPSQPSLVLTPPNWIYIYRKPNGQLETTTCNPWHLMPPSSSPLEQPKPHMQVLALDSKQILYSYHSVYVVKIKCIVPVTKWSEVLSPNLSCSKSVTSTDPCSIKASP
jgi:hypothetical protein